MSNQHTDKPSSGVTDFAATLATHFEKSIGVAQTSIIPIEQLDSLEVAQTDITISLLELEREFLPTISVEDTTRLKAITDTVTDLLWVTGGNMLGDAPQPNLTLSNGLSRALMLEQPALRYTVLDVGPVSQLGLKAQAASEQAVGALAAAYNGDDCEFIDNKGLLHVSRYSPDHDINGLFRRRIETQALEKQPLGTAHPARLAISRAGAADTIHFQQLSEEITAPPAGFVDIDVKAVSLNAKDVYALLGRADSRDKTTAFDFSGIVTAIGSGVKDVNVGDRAVAYAPHQLGTAVRVPAGSVHKLLDTEEFTVVPTLLLAYGTALYAINDRAHLREGESVLIHEGSDGLGIAAITLAQKIGATVYTTVDSQAKRDYLVNELGVPATNVFSSQDPSFVQGIKEATEGRGVDVIINSLVGDLLHDSWRTLAEFGRFVEVGKRELDDAGRLDMRVFLRNATFTAFDLSDLFYAKDPHNRAIWDRLMAETLELYRSGAIQPPPAKIFDAAEVSQAYQHFSTNKDNVGKVVLSLENAQARVPVS